jgi:ABC-type glycerol-3-phosphate transport system permease component
MFGVLTAVIGIAIVALTYFPIVFVLSNSLKSGQSIFSGDVFSLFTQFDVHNYALASAGIARALLNTVIVASISIVLGVGAAATGAYTFAQLQFRGKSLLFLAYIALLMIPWTLTLIHLVGADPPLCGGGPATAHADFP